MRIAIIGAGFWAHYQLHAWREQPGVELVGICDLDAAKAQQTARKFGIEAAYTDAREMLAQVQPDVVDIISSPHVHPEHVALAAELGLPAICQKPLAPEYETAQRMVAQCEAAGIPLLVHENFRWQHPLRQLKAQLDRGTIGKPFKFHVYFCCSFPVFENQPFLAELDQFILADLGVHHFDVVRFLFGEVASLYCRTARVNPSIKGEDVATSLLQMHHGMHGTVELSYASIREDEHFPETFVEVEGEKGSLTLSRGHRLATTTKEKTEYQISTPPRYRWADPAYDLIHGSMVACQANLLAGLRGEAPAETTGRDNLRSLALVDAAYRSAREGQVVQVG